ncbi:SHOCT domain-containing protein [Fodinicola acaciae]|uniref:SHOCT domain-containing protein n=1 Tax=Fodinicola acaciae TaxID=2681555 RepID=UPI0013D333DA|nr:SHOCT domain-containing protein [Fodinicola acaciae]
MMWWGNGMNFWGMLAMGGGTLLFWVVVIAAILALVGYLGRGTGRPLGRLAGPTPDQILAERFARGEIDEKDYRERLRVLHGTDQ